MPNDIYDAINPADLYDTDQENAHDDPYDDDGFALNPYDDDDRPDWDFDHGRFDDFGEGDDIDHDDGPDIDY